MAAGLGFKTFTTGEVLTAADTNGYLMQGINVFASTAARDASITSPQEGQFAFTKDTNSLWYYDGAAWVASGAAGDIEGVTAGIGISGGGTSGTVTVTNSMATAIDAKGDLVAGTAADTFARLAVGANATVLTADSAEATGLKWATAGGSSPSFTLLNSGGTAMTGAATITVSGISGKNSIFFRVSLGSSATASVNFYLRLNTDSGANYYYVGNGSFGDAVFTKQGVDNTEIVFAAQGGDAANYVNAYGLIEGANGTGIKPISYASFANGAGAGNYTGAGFYSGTSTISSLSIVSASGNFDAGTLYVYGA
jgi:hypothetical protein